MNEVLIHALAARSKAGQMTIEQVPESYREQVQEVVNNGGHII